MTKASPAVSREARRLQALELKACQAKKYKVTTDSEHDKPVVPDWLQQDFTAEGPNQKWVSAITYVWIREG
jgi:putative transposase